MKRLTLSIFALAATASQVMAGPAGPLTGPGSTPVPEISALEGTAALAALAAIVLLAWERRSRA